MCMYAFTSTKRILFIVAVAGVCRVAAFGDIELLEGSYESRLVNDECQVYSCVVRGKTYTDINMTLVEPIVQCSL
jgi:hypothetical protein